MFETLLNIVLTVLFFPIIIAQLVGVSHDMMFVAVLLNLMWLAFLVVISNK